MQLPTINTPKFSLYLPISDKTIDYRPFLVKEEKILLMAQEQNDQQGMLIAISDVINACLFEKIDALDLPIPELEYLFLKIRSKSIGETSDVTIRCTNKLENGEICRNPINVQINLEEIELTPTDLKDNVIQITDDIGVIMSLPTLRMFKEFDNKTESNLSFLMLCKCIESVYTKDNVIKTSDVEFSKVIEFVDNLQSNQTKKIKDYLESMPILQHTIKYKCDVCGAENEYVLKGIKDFF